MKKKNLKSLRINKKSISNFNAISASGGSGIVCNAETNIICPEPAETVGCGVESFWSYCPC
ncbi:hypothetical protein [Kordia sp.]|uniref:hypothetical protein n=1 Tax=Kordia sp. TaxID=1965332 RepID=UPI003D278AC9